ncbi:MAG: 30S ribosomal protein S7 [Candidatus Brennerbacteria bacterium CG11_big_fil_rev_8_21_14_0_20_43_10]|uniref:Small ribosomal subunit protein uS7 n=3 Tax=Candidatus Brenneribacteriota TaxID=1817902 RepID=A0A2M8C1C7_9BACT|nr:MAG: 30S ribosomal protein S7 [Parcubacteria group bacterium CG1_02_44_31]PIP50430.1 MAG: 30S ribosomal protein S7 [Candidatus Brennerbacteria bacterium CG23_combo_of_CG06-09_8_20_14_all_44_41]PIR26398.1 MAG: 30S ribosomal protein S7 [Candidatus Brennerbacteria bacterium CG11_big_fil_rev_8_21_14_0_20_43_10]PIX29412.1 MAG: 30S ribosomal protein S7 [Candidatus Brennerbacteria bacterium CG_4_8_14_3_um_filter_43_14]PJA19084.1 MAG: 30S ribosomal protein S7 [Candidatus Brennerbacteria bacterium CG
MRKKIQHKRPYPLDPKYQNAMVGVLINHVMKAGKKSVAQRIVYSAFDEIEKKVQQDPIGVFEQAMKNVAPVLEVRSKRIGGANYQVPIEVRGERKIALTMRWILGAARSQKGKPMYAKLAEQIMQASRNEGAAVKKRADVQRMAEANRAFAHFA